MKNLSKFSSNQNPNIIYRWAIATLVVIFSFNGISAQQACSDNDPSIPVGITPTTYFYNPNNGLEILPPQNPPYYPYSVVYNMDGINDITISYSDPNLSCGQTVTWTAPTGIIIDAICVKGGPHFNHYIYENIQPHVYSDGNLHCPLVGENTGHPRYANVSHLNLFWHYELIVSKTAETSFTREYNWSIDKQCNGSALTLSAGQTYTGYPFKWIASVTGFEDSEWQVSGNITIANPSPYSTSVTVTDQLEGAVVTCPTLQLAPNSTMTCTYTADLTGPEGGTNTVDVTSSNDQVEGGSASAEYSFGLPTTEVDECVTVTDDCVGSTMVCRTASPYTKTYSCPVGPYANCGQFTYTNTASFTTNDKGETGSDFCNVAVNVPCQTGCTLTQGYWKTHSSYGPAPYDDNWANVGENTPFYLSGKTWYEVLWTAPQGNAYYNLAHQYIAAYLNVLNGASDAAVVNELACAVTLFNTWTPAQVAGMSSTNKTRKKFLSVASILDNYNNGLIGPGHCSESQPQAMPATVTVPDQQDFETAETGQTDDRSQAEIGVVTVAPNPAGETVDLRAAGQYSRGHWMITDMGGRVVMTATKDDGVENSTIHVGMLPAGLYSVQFHTANSSLIYQAKMVIIR